MSRRSTKKKLYLLDDNHNSFRYVVFCLVNLIPDYNVIRADYIALRKKDLYVELI